MAVVLCCCNPSSPAPTVTSPPSTPGYLADTWSWDARAWHRVAGVGPSGRYLAAMAFDPQRADYVMFGGQTPSTTSDETWTSDGRSWKRRSPLHHPPAREGAAMAYDVVRQVVVMYGGLDLTQGEGNELGDTWSWDGTDWKQADPGSGAPGARSAPSMVSTPTGVLLFGGHNFNLAYYADLWSWTGAAWKLVDAAPRPPGRGGAAVEWVPKDGSLFVFGGLTIKSGGGPGEAGVAVGDSWMWDGRAWRKLADTGPGATAYADTLSDAASGNVVVLLGITCPDPSGAAWAWRATGWTKLPNPGISARWGAAEAQAPDGAALLFGGSNLRGC